MEPERTLTVDTLRRVMAEADLIMRPWAPLIGLVELRRTEYLERGACYALDPSRTNSLFRDAPLQQSVLLHPDDVEGVRVQVQAAERGRRMSDAELAAYLYWATHESRKDPSRGQ